MYFIVIYIIYQKSELFKYVFSITIGSSYSELKLAVQYDSETDERYSPWIQAIKSLKEKPRTTITKEEKNWWRNPKYSPKYLKKFTFLMQYLLRFFNKLHIALHSAISLSPITQRFF